MLCVFRKACSSGVFLALSSAAEVEKGNGNAQGPGDMSLETFVLCRKVATSGEMVQKGAHDRGI